MITPWRQVADDYFHTKVNRPSIEEREERIAELVADGFEVVRYYENVEEKSSSRTGLINNRKVIERAYDGGTERANYGAVLRRPNER